MRLNIIGCGKLGMTLGRLWTESGRLEVGGVLNRSYESAQRAISFMGAGQALQSMSEFGAADAWLIATPDSDIASVAEVLSRHRALTPSCIVFHCSGALPSATLAPLAARGIAVGSAHPIRSFAEPAQAAASFDGTFCGIEGDDAALAFLIDVFSSIGGKPVPVAAEFKTIYHAAAVFASNYLVTLLDIAVQAYAKSGIPPDTALKLMEPLVRGTVENVFRLGPAAALTGPIARGDIATAVKQYRALNDWDEELGAVYKQLAKITADLAARRSPVGNSEG